MLLSVRLAWATNFAGGSYFFSSCQWTAISASDTSMSSGIPWLPKLSAARRSRKFLNDRQSVRRTPGVLKRTATRPLSDPGEAADHAPLGRADRADREARLAQQREAGEGRHALHLGEPDRALYRHYRGDIDHAELAARVAGIGVEGADDLDDADDLLALVRVIEEGAVAVLHCPQIVRRLEIAHAVPMGAAVRNHPVPRIFRRFGFQEPVGHRISSPLSGSTR